MQRISIQKPKTYLQMKTEQQHAKKKFEHWFDIVLTAMLASVFTIAFFKTFF